MTDPTPAPLAPKPWYKSKTILAALFGGATAVTTAVLALLTYEQILTAEEAGLWAGIVAAFIGIPASALGVYGRNVATQTIGSPSAKLEE